MKTSFIQLLNRRLQAALICVILAGNVFILQAVEVPAFIQQLIQQEYPGSKIHEIRKDIWKGQSVIEVEITTKEGIDYEVIVSESGEILNVEEEKGLPLIGGELSMGLAVMLERGIYKGTDAEAEPAPFILYENGPIEIMTYNGADVTYTPYANDWFHLFLGCYLAFEEGYDSDDSDELEGMDELDTLYGGFAGVGFQWRNWEFALEVQQDLSGEHDGQEVEVSFGYSKAIAGFIFHPSVSFTWLSEKNVEYFYGVSESEAREDRPVYSPGSSYEFGAELLIRKPLFGKFTAIGLIEFSGFGSEIRNSPIVDEDYEMSIALGFMYTF